MHEVNPAVLGSVALVSDLALDLRDIDISCVNDKEGRLIDLHSRRRRGRGCRAARFANARLALMSMIWLKGSSCMDRRRRFQTWHRRLL